jgi:hypothetical protein
MKEEHEEWYEFVSDRGLNSIRSGIWMKTETSGSQPMGCMQAADVFHAAQVYLLQ